MTKKELSKAVELAKARSGVPFENTSLELFNGFALNDFSAVHVRLEDIADLIRWQCNQFNGGFDTEALQEIAVHGKNKFMVVG